MQWREKRKSTIERDGVQASSKTTPIHHFQVTTRTSNQWEDDDEDDDDDDDAGHKRRSWVFQLKKKMNGTWCYKQRGERHGLRDESTVIKSERGGESIRIHPSYQIGKSMRRSRLDLSRRASIAQTQLTDERFKQPLVTRLCCSAQVCRSGKASQTACTAFADKLSQWLTFKHTSPMYPCWLGFSSRRVSNPSRLIGSLLASLQVLPLLLQELVPVCTLCRRDTRNSTLSRLFTLTIVRCRFFCWDCCCCCCCWSSCAAVAALSLDEISVYIDASVRLGQVDRPNAQR